jgi:ribonuclease HI
MRLDKHNSVHLKWVLGQEGIKGNDTDDQLVKVESQCQLTESEPAWGILARIAKKVIRD